MNEIKCPHCGKVFSVDETSYDAIAKQVRDHLFETEVKNRIDLNQKDNELKTKKQLDDLKDALNIQIEELNKKNNDLIMQLKTVESDNNLKINEQLQQQERKYQQQINDLTSKLNGFEQEKTIALQKSEADHQKAIFAKEQEIIRLQNDKKTVADQAALKQQSLVQEYESKLKQKDDQIDYYKDLKLSLSTKMLGETLEQHCWNSYNKTLRPLLPNAYFEKDNDASSGSKGDFIFRDYDEGMEYISIMFEMKNEADLTATKHRNEDFLKELDKDRNQKACEYAILVSTLEADSELYNEGIVDVSYRYPKMYVIRPQFFTSMITLLVNASKNSIKYQHQLQIEREQNIDINNFEANMNAFKDAFSRNYELASRKFQDAIDDIDRTIKALEKTKADLLSSDRNLRLANDKAQDLTIKKLTKNAPGVAKMFEKGKE